MDSEMKKIFGGVGIAMTFFALLIFSFLGDEYQKYVFVLYGFVGLVLSVLGGILLSLGKKYNATKFYTSLLIFCVLPLVIASFLYFFILLPLKNQGLLTFINMSCFVIFGTVVLLYLNDYEKYRWKTYYIQEEEKLGIQIIAAQLLFVKYRTPYHYMRFFMRKSFIFNTNRVNDKKRFWENSEYQFLRMPNGLEITYYSKKEQQLYKSEYAFSKRKVRALSSFGFLFPLIRYQKYNCINLVLFTKGEINLQLGNSHKDVFFLKASTIPLL